MAVELAVPKVTITRLDGPTFVGVLEEKAKDLKIDPSAIPNIADAQHFATVDVVLVSKDRKHAVAVGKECHTNHLLRDGEIIYTSDDKDVVEIGRSSPDLSRLVVVKTKPGFMNCLRDINLINERGDVMELARDAAHWAIYSPTDELDSLVVGYEKPRSIINFVSIDAVDGQRKRLFQASRKTFLGGYFHPHSIIGYNPDSNHVIWQAEYAGVGGGAVPFPSEKKLVFDNEGQIGQGKKITIQSSEDLQRYIVLSKGSFDSRTPRISLQNGQTFRRGGFQYGEVIWFNPDLTAAAILMQDGFSDRHHLLFAFTALGVFQEENFEFYKVSEAVVKPDGIDFKVLIADGSTYGINMPTPVNLAQ